MRAPLFLAALVIALVVPTPAQAANFGAHAGLADDVWGDPYFSAGALLPDVDHFLPPGEPQTDSLAFSQGIVSRAWPLSRNAWRFASGWYEHLDQDARFADADNRVVAAYPSYTDADVRLAFDYWTLRKHPFPTNYDWILEDGELLALIAGGLTATNTTGVRAAVDALLHSPDVNNPGLALQVSAAQAYGAFYPDRVADMEPEYDRYYARATAGFVEVLPRIDLRLQKMRAIVIQHAMNSVILLKHLQTATILEAFRPPGWMTQEVVALAAFVDALHGAGLPLRAYLLLNASAQSIIRILS